MSFSHLPHILWPFWVNKRCIKIKRFFNLLLFFKLDSVHLTHRDSL